MDHVSRPTTDTVVLAKAKRCVNNAISVLQQERALARSMKSISYTYSAAAFSVPLDTINGAAEVRSVRSVQLVSATGTSGFFLPLHSHESLLNAQQEYQLGHSVPQDETELNFVLTNLGHSTHTTALHKYVAFLEGGSLGLYPTPASNVYLRLFVCDWLVDLGSDGDTNFILTFGYRTVYMLALQELMLFLRMGSDYPYTENELNKAQQAFYSWDASQITGDLNSL